MLITKPALLNIQPASLITDYDALQQVVPLQFYSHCFIMVVKIKTPEKVIANFCPELF